MRIPECDVTYIVSSVYFYLRLSVDTGTHRTGNSRIRDKVNLIQLSTFELELDFAQYSQYTDVRTADLCLAPICHLPGYLLLWICLNYIMFHEMSHLFSTVSRNSW